MICRIWLKLKFLLIPNTQKYQICRYDNIPKLGITFREKYLYSEKSIRKITHHVYAKFDTQMRTYEDD